MMKELEVRGARRQALQVFRFLQAQPSVKLREQNFVTIISILGREGKLGLAREIFDSLKELGIATSVHSYTGLISG
jgi:pentatricopeptide repeat protein